MKTSPIKILVLAAMAAFMATACNNNSHDAVKDANDANKQNADSMTAPAVVNPDAEFATKAANGGMAEVEMGKLASQKGQNAQVKAFGDMMVTDHTKGGEELKKVAASKNVTLPATIGNDEQKMLDDLSKKPEKDFDKAYINAMVKDHQEDIGEFKKESTGGKDTDFKAFATNTLPVLQKHLDAALAAQKTLEGK